jgi:hypothetical protein
MAEEDYNRQIAEEFRAETWLMHQQHLKDGEMNLTMQAEQDSTLQHGPENKPYGPELVYERRWNSLRSAYFQKKLEKMMSQRKSSTRERLFRKTDKRSRADRKAAKMARKAAEKAEKKAKKAAQRAKKEAKKAAKKAEKEARRAAKKSSLLLKRTSTDKQEVDFFVSSSSKDAGKGFSPDSGKGMFSSSKNYEGPLHLERGMPTGDVPIRNITAAREAYLQVFGHEVEAQHRE